MRTSSRLVTRIAAGVFLGAFTMWAGNVSAQTALLTPGDPIIAFDSDITPDSSYPEIETPNDGLDPVLGKYLNFGRENSGLIVTPAVGSTVIQSMQFQTANDHPERDPDSWVIYGTNEAIQSTDNSQGFGESWTMIGMGAAMLPGTPGCGGEADCVADPNGGRFELGPVYDLSANTTSYSSYKLVFPTVKENVTPCVGACSANSMQVQVIDLRDANGSFAGYGDFALAIDEDPPGGESSYPAGESPALGIDNDLGTKYLNFGDNNSGFIVTPSVGSSVLESFEMWTANDAEGRDPATYSIFGTNAAINSVDNGGGQGEPWTLIDSGVLALPAERNDMGVPMPGVNSSGMVTVNNAGGDAYTSYKFVVDTTKGDDIMQFGDVQFFGTASMTGVSGDFNNDGNWDCTDVDALVAEIFAGTNNAAFDMTGDGMVNTDDLMDATAGWLTVGGANNPDETGGNPFLLADANLDGFVDVSDRNIWNSNKFTNTPAWCSGDFNADGFVDVSDLNLWNTWKFMQSADAVNGVPEPASWTLLSLAALGLFARRTRRS